MENHAALYPCIKDPKNSIAQIKNSTQPRLWLEVTLLGLLPSANTFRVINPTTQTIMTNAGVSDPVAKVVK